MGTKYRFFTLIQMLNNGWPWHNKPMVDWYIGTHCFLSILIKKWAHLNNLFVPQKPKFKAYSGEEKESKRVVIF